MSDDGTLTGSAEADQQLATAQIAAANAILPGFGTVAALAAQPVRMATDEVLGTEINWVNWSYKWLTNPGDFLVQAASGFRKPKEHGKKLVGLQKSLRKDLDSGDAERTEAALARIGAGIPKLGDCSHASKASSCVKHRTVLLSEGSRYLGKNYETLEREAVDMSTLQLDSNSPSVIPDWLGAATAGASVPAPKKTSWNDLGSIFATLAPVAGNIIASRTASNAAKDVAKTQLQTAKTIAAAQNVDTGAGVYIPSRDGNGVDLSGFLQAIFNGGGRGVEPSIGSGSYAGGVATPQKSGASLSEALIIVGVLGAALLLWKKAL